MTTEKGSANKIIAKRAKQDLASHGFQQQGRSRLWFKDEGLWLYVIEFQPSSRQIGSFLNLSVMWLWNLKDHFSFDEGLGEYGARVADFITYRNDEQFDLAMQKLTGDALKGYFDIQPKLKSASDLAKFFEGRPRKSIWNYANAASAFSLAMKPELAKIEFEAILAIDAKAPFEVELQTEAREGLKLVDQPEKLQEGIKSRIKETRTLFKLPEITKSF